MGIQAASCFTITRWQCEFKAETVRNNIDEPNGRPESALNEGNVAAVAKLMKGDRHSCTREISARLTFLFGTVKKILHKELHLRKLATKWVSHKLTDQQ